MELPDYALFVSFAEARARKLVAKENNLPSGAIRVLNGIAFRHSQKKNTHSKDIYAEKLASPTLLRAYLAKLVDAGMVQRIKFAGRSHLSITLTGLGLVSQFQRELRTNMRQFSQA